MAKAARNSGSRNINEEWEVDTVKEQEPRQDHRLGLSISVSRR